MKVVIAEGLSPQKVLLEGLELLNSKLEFSHDHTVLIIIDFPIPTSTPASVNPNTLGALISYLKGQKVNRILIYPATLDGVNSDVALKMHGLDKFIQQKGGELINRMQLFSPQKVETNNGETSFYPPLIFQIDDYVIISQLRTDPRWQIHAAISTMQHFLPHDKRFDRSFLPPNQNQKPLSSPSNQDSSDFSTHPEIDAIQNILRWKKPALVINDGFLMLDGNGPFLWRKPSIQTLHRIFLSTDIFAVDWITLQHFGFDPMSSPGLIGEKFLESLGAQIEMVTSSSLSSPSPLRFAEQELEKIRIHGLSLYLGDLSDHCRSILTQLLYQLDLLFFKDGPNLGSWALVAGHNPPQPPVDIDLQYIILGIDAIEDTHNYDFRVIPKHFYNKPINILGFEFGAGKTLTGDDLDRLIITKQRKIRKKQQKLRNKFSTLQSLLKEKVDVESARLVELQRHRTLDLKIAEMETKIQQIRINTRAKHQKQAVQDRKIKTILNRRIMEIPGDLRSAWDVLPYLHKIWKPYQIPTLSLYLRNSKEWFQYQVIDTKAIKKQWKNQYEHLKANLTQLNAPLLNQIKEDLAKIQLERKKILKGLSLESNTIKREIEAKYNPPIKQLQKTLRSARIDKFKSRFNSKLKFKNQSLPDSSPDKTQGDLDNV